VVVAAAVGFGEPSAMADPAAQITELVSSSLNASNTPAEIAPGADGHLWFSDDGATKAIGRIDPSTGQVTEFSSGLNTGSFPFGIATGADGNVWFADQGSTKAIGRIDPSNGQVTEFSSGLNTGSHPAEITTGADGNLWFTDQGTTGAIGRAIPSTGQIKEFSSGLITGSTPTGITTGADGDLWFADEVGAIGRINPSTGEITEFTSGLKAGSMPAEIAPGPDGNLWFTDRGSTRAIGRIIPSSGQITEFTSGLNMGNFPVAIAPGTDGNLWFTDEGSTRAIGRIIPSSGQITEFTSGLNAGSVPAEIAPAADGNLWFTDDGSNRDRADRDRRPCGGCIAAGRFGFRAGGNDGVLPDHLFELGGCGAVDFAVLVRCLPLGSRRGADRGPERPDLYAVNRGCGPPAGLLLDRHIPAAFPGHNLGEQLARYRPTRGSSTGAEPARVGFSGPSGDAERVETLAEKLLARGARGTPPVRESERDQHAPAGLHAAGHAHDPLHAQHGGDGHVQDHWHSRGPQGRRPMRQADQPQRQPQDVRASRDSPWIDHPGEQGRRQHPNPPLQARPRQLRACRHTNRRRRPTRSIQEHSLTSDAPGLDADPARRQRVAPLEPIARSGPSGRQPDGYASTVQRGLPGSLERAREELSAIEPGLRQRGLARGVASARPGTHKSWASVR
jgi:streptogramin lyase